MTNPRRVAVLRALGLGDMMCAVPALRALRGAWPEAQIALVALPWAREFADRFRHLIDQFIEFPGWPGLPERRIDLPAIPRFLKRMQQEQFDLAIQLHGAGRFVNELVALFGARHAVGFARPGDFVTDREHFAPWPESGLEIQRLLSLVRFLKAPVENEALKNEALRNETLEFPVAQEDFALLARLPGVAELGDDRYAVVHPGASTPTRRWPPHGFAAVADALSQSGLRIVFTGVAGEDPLVDEVMGAMHRPAINLAGLTELGTLGALVADAALVVANDTGISHVAAALKTPSVIVSTGTNPLRWAPADARLHRVLCGREVVRPEEVLLAAEQLLALGVLGGKRDRSAPRECNLAVVQAGGSESCD